MALTLVTAPPNVGGTRRPIIVQLTSDTSVTSGGVANNTITRIDAAANEGDTWLFNFNGNTVIFVAKDSPEHNGNEFPAGSTNANSIKSYLEDNYLLTSHYDITIPSAGNIQFVAKEKGTVWDLLHTGSTWGGFTQWQFIDGEDVSTLANFQAWLDLYVEQGYLSNDFGDYPVAKLMATKDPKGRFTFDLSAILDAYVEGAPPDADDTVVGYIANKLLRRYKFQYMEAYGSPIEPKGVTLSNAYTALFGQKKNSEEGLAGNVFADEPLTVRPPIKEVTAAQNEFIYLHSSGYSVLLSLTVHFTDGTNETGSTPAVPNIVGNTVLRIPAGHDQLGVATVNPAKEVTKYVLGIEIKNTDASPPVTVATYSYTFQLLKNCQRHVRHFVFRNEMGGYDTLRTTGLMNHQGAFERSSGHRSLPANYALATDRERFDYQPSATDDYEIHTGWVFTKEEVEYYGHQFLRSENVLLYEEGAFVPVILLTKELRYSKDRNPLFGFPFKFRRSVGHGERHGVYLG